MTRLLRAAWDRLSIYLPIILMGCLALGTYWLVRNTPIAETPEPQRAARHEPDYFMRNFSVKNFDADGKLRSEIFGSQAHHFPDTDTLEVDAVRMRSFDLQGRLTTAQADHALSNGDGSEVQLLGSAVVVREPSVSKSGVPSPRMEFRSEFLHAFTNTERIKSHKPVVLIRGNDRFSADAMDYDNLQRILELHGRVVTTFAPRFSN